VISLILTSRRQSDNVHCYCIFEEISYNELTMRLYEYEAKALFRRYGIPVPRGVTVDEDTMNVLNQVAYPIMVKAQVFMGGRSKAGLIQSAHDRNEAEQKIREMLGKHHGEFPVKKVLIEEKIEIEKEFYVAATVDRFQHKPLIIVSEYGGIDIEEIAKEKPFSILKYYFNLSERVLPYQARNIAYALNLRQQHMQSSSEIFVALYSLFLKLDCKLAEINPLVLTTRGQFLALDAKVDLDEDAMFRHPELKELGIVARHEIGEMTEYEKIAKVAGIPYVDLDGDIGVFPGGAGFGIAAIDLIAHYGGKPANFMDSGGAPTPEKLRTMLGLLLENPRVKAIFGARFGGISRCDDWAKAVVQYILENEPQKPMIMRMAGNMEEEGRRILEQAKQDHPQLFENIKIYAYDMPIEEVIKETIRIAEGI
jgi:succinyl-CoA synthetase beta subunit